MDSKEKDIKQYMVVFDVPMPFPTDLYGLIPEQRDTVEALFTAGKLLSYSLSLDRGRLWAVFLASAESELLQHIDALPLSGYMDYDYWELMFHQSLKLLPAMSLN